LKNNILTGKNVSPLPKGILGYGELTTRMLRSRYGVELRVHPTMIGRDSMIAKVDGVMNAVSVIGDAVGETMYYGAGAGGDATASAVIADIVDIVRGNTTPMLGYKRGLEVD